MEDLACVVFADRQGRYISDAICKGLMDVLMCAGATGATGANGFSGAIGASGFTGFTGASGATGYTGVLVKYSHLDDAHLMSFYSAIAPSRLSFAQVLRIISCVPSYQS